MTRPPPSSTLFPYTTLFRSTAAPPWPRPAPTPRARPRKDPLRLSRTPQPIPRSEEHTSELQSPYDLVCRLLLEKKNTNVATSDLRYLHTDTILRLDMCKVRI